ncbi:MAG: hypothetical protein AAF468_15715 [Pseudomonadota bacterium]
MVQDRPENPRIRTKINRWNDHDDSMVFGILERLRADDISPDQTLCELLDAFQEMDLLSSLSEEIAEAEGSDDQLWLIRRHVDHRRYTVLLCPVKEGEVHPPHGHHNLISLQIVLKGQIHLREYDRVSRNENGTLVLIGRRDAVLGPGDVFVASDEKNNVHWFCGHDGPTMIFNINVRGYAPTVFEEDEDGFGRRYLDPTRVRADNLIEADEFDKDEAERRFQGKPVSGFDFPADARPVSEPLRISL